MQASFNLLRGAARCFGVLTVCVGSAYGSIAWAQSHDQIQQITKPQIMAVEKSKAERTPAQDKISSQLLDTLRKRQTGSVNKSAPALKVDDVLEADTGVIVDIKAKVSPELLAEIAERKGKVLTQHPRFDAVRAAIPLSALEGLAARPDVKSIAPAAQATTNAAPVAQEGTIAHTANLARTEFGVTGKGVVACVISDSLDDGRNALQQAIQTGAIDPSKLHVLPNQEGKGSGEGLAMLEIVHAIAPDAELWFATGFSGPEQMAENILDLKEAGCHVIIDDVTYFNESPFQDGPISMAVEEVSDAGVLYFSSARNSGNKKHGTSGTWEGDFADGGDAGAKFGVTGGRVHIFEDGVTLNTVTSARGDRVDLFWSDPLGGSNNGYDLFVVNRFGQIVRSSTTSHTGTQDPYQSVDDLHSGESIVIVKEGDATGRFLHLDTGRAVLRHSTNGNVRGHNASGAANAYSVAAMRVPSPAIPFVAGETQAVEQFSSDGPRRMFFDPAGAPLTAGDFSASGGKLIQKPDITAADGVSTTLPGTSGLNPFLGTSAAAPHAGAIAALLLSCQPRPTAQQIRSAFKSSALAIDGAASNFNAGYGIIMAHAAVNALCPRQAQTVRLGGAQP